jgi:hypothetical protein
VSSSADVAAEWSEDMMGSEVAPVRDAIIAGETAALLKYQRTSRYAAAQSDRLRATGEYLDEIGWENGINRQDGETGAAGDTTYRARINAIPSVVDPNDIILAANAVLSPYTTISCRYAERSDGLFLTTGDAVWVCPTFVEVGTSNPHYPDRLYPDATPAGLTSVVNRRPPPCMLNGDSYGRWFLLRAPDVGLVDSTVAGSYAGDTTDPTEGLFISSGTSANNSTFLFNFTSTVDQIYGALVSSVEAIRGHGIRWTLFVDPNLTV